MRLVVLICWTNLIFCIDRSRTSVNTSTFTHGYIELSHIQLQGQSIGPTHHHHYHNHNHKDVTTQTMQRRHHHKLYKGAITTDYTLPALTSLTQTIFRRLCNEVINSCDTLPTPTQTTRRHNQIKTLPRRHQH